MVSPETRNSSIRMYQGPIDSRPEAARAPDAAPRPRAGPRGSRRPRPSGRRAGSGSTRGRPRAAAAGRRAADQPEPEGLERLVPLPVPVGVRDDHDAAGHAGKAMAPRRARAPARCVPSAGDTVLRSLGRARRPPRPMNAVPSPPLPAWWSARWAADPGAEILRVAGPGDLGSTGWIRAGELEERTRAAARRLQGHGVVPGDRVLWSAQRSAGVGWWPRSASCASDRSSCRSTRRSPGASSATWWATSSRGWPSSTSPGRGPAGGRGPRRARARAGRRAGSRRGGPGGAHGVGTHARYSTGSGAATSRWSSTRRARPVAPRARCSPTPTSPPGCPRSIEAWHWTPSDRLSLALPLFHVHGLFAGLFGSLASGGSAVVLPRFDPGAGPRQPGAARRHHVLRGAHHVPPTGGDRAGRAPGRPCASASRAPRRSRRDLWHGGAPPDGGRPCSSATG